MDIASHLFFNDSQPSYTHLNYSLLIFDTWANETNNAQTVTRIYDNGNSVVNDGGGGGGGGGPKVVFTGELRIALYSIIFFLSVVGNILVIVTLVQHRRMRTVTNVFLLNLSISDLLLAVFCMPFTLIPTLLRDFIFGRAMCVLIRYMQGVSVGVSVFTLVAISMERYFAICQPLRSRAWQTLSHAYKIIAAVWLLSLVIMVPIAVFQKLVEIKGGAHKCMELWSDDTRKWERVYSVLLVLVLLVIPLLLMLIFYSLISSTLWEAMHVSTQSEMRELRHTSNNNSSTIRGNGTTATTTTTTGAGEYDLESEDESNLTSAGPGDRQSVVISMPTFKRARQIHARMRQSNTDRSLQAKKRVIKMLFVVVLEFFVFWTPMYVMNTWFVFDEQSAVRHVNPVAMNFIHLISYVSSCCNPITYCFMNQKFRQGFLSAFRCCCPLSARRRRQERQRTMSRYSSCDGLTLRPVKPQANRVRWKMGALLFCTNPVVK